MNNINPNWIAVMEMITPLLLMGAVLVFYVIHRKHQNKKARSKK